MDSGFLRPSTATRIKERHRKKAFLTKLQLQDPPRVIALDRGGVPVPAQEVLIVWANREPTGEGGDTTDVLGIEGEIQRWQELDAEVGDLFMIDGRLAEIIASTSARTGGSGGSGTVPTITMSYNTGTYMDGGDRS